MRNTAVPYSASRAARPPGYLGGRSARDRDRAGGDLQKASLGVASHRLAWLLPRARGPPPGVSLIFRSLHTLRGAVRRRRSLLLLVEGTWRAPLACGAENR